MIMVVVAFACLGFLIGNLVGLSAESTLAVVIPLLFSFGGGSAVALLPKLDQPSRKEASAAVIALSVSCLAGVYSGILVSEYQFLSPRASSVSGATSIAEKKYLRSLNLNDVDRIDQRYRAGDLTADKAYEQLYQLISSGSSK